MQISNLNNLPYAGNDYYYSTTGTQTYNSNTTETNKSALQLSPLLQVAYQNKLSEFSYSSDETTIGYRSEDNSMALRAHSHTDFHSRQETISIEATFSAESLGLTAEDFATIGNKPFEFSLSFQKSDLQIDYKASAKYVTPTRTTDELLRDLGKALTRAIGKDGDNVQIKFDDEAIRTLMTDPEVAKVFQQILGLINLINMMKRQQNSGKKEDIEISGKGKPFIDVDEQTNIESSESTVNIKFTILPPGGQNASVEATAAPEPAPAESSVDVTA